MHDDSVHSNVAKTGPRAGICLTFSFVNNCVNISGGIILSGIFQVISLNEIGNVIS